MSFLRKSEATGGATIVVPAIWSGVQAAILMVTYTLGSWASLASLTFLGVVLPVSMISLGVVLAFAAGAIAGAAFALLFPALSAWALGSYLVTTQGMPVPGAAAIGVLAGAAFYLIFLIVSAKSSPEMSAVEKASSSNTQGSSYVSTLLAKFFPGNRQSATITEQDGVNPQAVQQPKEIAFPLSPLPDTANESLDTAAVLSI